MAGNTEILIKRSLTTGVPTSLQQGELAYSYTSNTIFIGTPDGLGTVNVGGQFYTSQIDNATNSATADTLVRRDGSGDASFNTIYGALGTATGVVADTYGDATHIPIITVGANGLITTATTSEISTTLQLDSESGANTMSLLTGTLNFYGGEGINTSIEAGTSNVVFQVDTTVVRSNTAVSIQSINGSVEINGNLSVLGTSTTVNTDSLNVSDPLIYLAGNNSTSDIVDIGFSGKYFDGSNERHMGLFRDAGNKEFYVFDNYDKDISSNNNIDVADASFRVANLHANLISTLVQVTDAKITTANVSGDLDVAGNSYLNNLNVGGTTTLTGQANTTNDLGVGGNLYITGAAHSDTLFVSGLPQANTNYVVYYDTTSKELKYDTLDTLSPDNLANGSAMFAVSSDNYAYSSGKILAAQSSSGTTGGGFSFTGTEGGADTGMFSSADGVLDLYSNNVLITQITPTSIKVYTDLTLQNGNLLGDTSGGLYFGSNITGVTTGSIVFNNSGNNLSALTDGLFIDPVRYTAHQDTTYDGLMFYNASTKEIRYSYTLDGGSF